jgi:endonuclease/exonuclease/phosphatase family metal-dependent hydrolase
MVRLAGCGRAVKQLTVVSYNNRLGSRKNGERSLREQLALLKEIDADIIGLQASDTPRPSAGNLDLALYFANELGYHMYFGPPCVGGTFGTAILSKYPLQNVRTLYSFSDVDETGTAVAEFEVGGRRIAFLNSHPAGEHPSHQAHTDAVIEIASTYEHVIAVGDYNHRQDSSYYADLSKVLTNSWAAVNPSAIGPRHPSIGVARDGSTEPLDMSRRIDHIYVSDTFRVDEAYYVPIPESMSDHLIHWAVLSWD